MKKLNNNGITLMALVITIIILIILASIGTYSGIQVVKSARFTAFSTELKIMQTRVNKLYDEINNGERNINDIGKNISNNDLKAKNAFDSCNITADRADYKLFDIETIENLHIEGISREFLVNLNTRSVISYEGFEYEGTTYYTLNQLPDGLYNVNYNEDTSNKPTFNIKVVRIKSGNYEISVEPENINYNGNINKWNLEYKLEEDQDFKESKDLRVKVDNEGTYKIKVANGNFKSDENIIVIREPQIGDYVNYDPLRGVTDTSKLTYTSVQGTATQHGNGYGTQTYEAKNTMKWRILNIDNNKVELISTETIKKNENEDNGNFILYGAIGYLYYEQELNEICKIYGYGYGADENTITKYTIGGPYEGEENIQTISGSGARSINIDDINKLSGVHEEKDQEGNYVMKYKSGTVVSNQPNYGRTDYPSVNIYYPTLNPNKGDASGQSNLPEVKEIKSTYYSYGLEHIPAGPKRDMVNNKYYWLASREINCASNRTAYFGMRFIKNTMTYNFATFQGIDTNFTRSQTDTNEAILPIVSIKNDLLNIQNIEGIGTEENPWIFK